MATKRITLPQIVADLKQWELDIPNKIARGIVFGDTRSDAIEDGKPVIIRNYKYTSFYPKLKGNEGAYYLLRNNLGEYFRLKVSEKKP